MKLPQDQIATKAWYNYVFSRTSDNNQYFRRIIHPELDQVTELTQFFSHNFETKHGIQTKWFDNGDTLSTGHYHYNKKEGPWKYFGHSDLPRKSLKKGNYHRGKREGKWTTFSDGNVLSIYNYKNGKLHGEFIKYKFNGDIKNQGVYENGELISETNPTNNLEYHCMGGVSVEDKNFPNYILSEVLKNYQISYPEDSRRKSIEGKAEIILLMDTNGQLKKFYVINGICNAITDECIKLIKSIKPCSDEDISEKELFYVTVPFNFKLQ